MSDFSQFQDQIAKPGSDTIRPKQTHATPQELNRAVTGEARPEDEERSAETTTHIRRSSDPETLTLSSQAPLDDAARSAKTVSLRSTPEKDKNKDVAEQEPVPEEGSASKDKSGQNTGPKLQMPTLSVPPPSGQPKKDDEPKKPEPTLDGQDPAAAPSQPSDSRAGQYGKILHDALVTLVDKQGVLVKMQKDLQESQDRFSWVQQDVVTAHHAVVDAQKRVVMAQTDLVSELKNRLDEMKQLQEEVQSEHEEGCNCWNCCAQ